uniref:MADS-box transcription factor 14 n=1 Tax=Anthurium amnicola TaxID=1678845 RepID=A0A1D1YRA1_9ARAE
MNAKARRLSLWRRGRGVRKKAAELALLCDASMCLIHFDQEGRLHALPDDPAQLNAVLRRYLRAGKAKQRRDGVEKTAEGDREGKAGLGDRRLDAMRPTELGELTLKLKAKAREVADRIALLKGGHGTRQYEGVLKAKAREEADRIAPLNGGHSTRGSAVSSSASLHGRLYLDGTPYLPEDLQMSIAGYGGIRLDEGSRIIKVVPSYKLYRDGTPCLPDHLQMMSTSKNVDGEI